jgi:hypothetical protein
VKAQWFFSAPAEAKKKQPTRIKEIRQRQAAEAHREDFCNE